QLLRLAGLAGPPAFLPLEFGRRKWRPVDMFPKTWSRNSSGRREQGIHAIAGLPACVTGCQHNELIAAGKEKVVRAGQNPNDPLLNESGKGRIDLSRGAGVRKMDFPARERARPLLSLASRRQQWDWWH